MTDRQLMILKSLFEYESAGAKMHDYVEVLTDAPPEDVAFTEGLVKHGDIVAYRTRSEKSGLPCFAFRGFTPDGHKVYDSFMGANEIV